MDLQEFSDKIKSLAREGRIGVSDRVTLLDEGKALGLNRMAINDMIDKAIAEARSGANEEAASVDHEIDPVKVPTEVELPTNDIRTDDLPEQNVDAPPPTGVEYEPSITPIQTPESIPTPTTGDLDQQIEVEEVKKFEESIDPVTPPETNPDAVESSKQAMEDALHEVKKQAGEKNESSFEQEVQQVEQQIDKALGPDNNDEPDQKKPPAEGDSPLAEGLLVFIAGIIAIISSGTYLAMFICIGGFVLAFNGRKKVKEQGAKEFLPAHLRFLLIGNILLWIGLGLFVFNNLARIVSFF